MNPIESGSPDRRGTSWRLAARLARREVRRRPGRTVLVMLLVALPVIAMTGGSVLFRTGQDSYTERFTRTNGAADLATSEYLVGDMEARLALLPTGSRAVRPRSAWVPLTPEDGSVGRRYADVTDLPVDDPITAGIVELTEGRAPRAGEVLLTAPLARHLGVVVGDTLRLAQPPMRAEVAGIGRWSERFEETVLVAPGFDFSIVRPEFVNERALVDLPAGLVPSTVATDLAARDAVFDAADREISREGSDGETLRPLAWGWVTGTLLLAVMGIIITAAFATSARRQLVTLGQLSANGADQRLLRRSLSLQGSWSGLLGATFGVAAAIATLLAFRPTVERIIQRDPGPYVFAPVDLLVVIATGIVAATVAAFVPARTITRVPALSALGGRRPLGAVPRRLVPTGLALFAGGVALLVLAAAGGRGGTGSGDLFAAAAIAGGLAVLGGVCCISPVVVGGFGAVATRVGGSARLAARSLARVRTRSAAVVTAVAVAGALAVAVATFIAMDRTEPEARFFPDDVVTYEGFDPTGTASRGFVPAPDSARAAVARIVPGIRFSPVREALYQGVAPAGDARLATESPRTLTVADPAVLDMVGLSDRDAAALARTGVLELARFAAPPSSGEIRLRTGAGVPYRGAVRRDEPSTRGGGIELLVTPRRAEELGLVLTDVKVLGRAPAALTEDQRARLLELDGGMYSQPFVATRESADPGAVVSFESPNPTVSDSTVQLAIVGGALLFTLLVVAIGLALSAAESREERDVLMAVGARPRTMRRVAGFKALGLAVAGALLAIPTGFVPVTLVVRAGTTLGSEVKPVAFPWLTVALLLVAVPLIAAAATWLCSRVAQWARPLQMSTVAVD